MTLPLAWVLEGPFTLALRAETLLAIGYFSIVATAGAYLLYYWVLARAGSGNLLLVTLLVAPVAIVLGALLLDEALAPNAYAGFALLACGLVVLYSAELESTQAAVEKCGGEIIKPIFSFPGGRRFHFADSNGNELAVWSEG